MQHPLISGYSSTLSAGATVYTPISEPGDDAGTSETDHKLPVSAPGSIKSMYVDLPTAPGSGETVVFTLMLNGSPTVLTATVSGTGTTANDVANTVAVVQGDLLSIRAVASNNGGYTGSSASVAVKFCSTNYNEANIIGGVDGSGDGFGNLVRWLALSGMSSMNTTELDTSQVMPCAGTLKRMTVWTDGGPGVGDTRTLTVSINEFDSALEVTLSGSDNTGEDNTNEVVVAEGDLVSVHHTYTGSPATSTEGGWGITFVPDNPGEYPLMHSHYLDPDQSATEYQYMQGSGWNEPWHATEANRQAIIPMPLHLIKMFVSLETAPGAGKSWDFTLRNNGGSTTVTDEVAETATTANFSPTASVVTAAGDLLNWMSVPTSTPALTDGTKLSVSVRYIPTYSVTNIEALEHDTDQADYNSMVKIDASHFALAYRGTSNDGFFKTFSHDGSYETITEVDSLEFDTAQGSDISLVMIDTTHFIIAYGGDGNDGYLKTFSTDSGYDNITEIDSLEHDTNTGLSNSLVMIDPTHFALAYTGSGNDGFIKTFSIDGSYDTITEIDSLEHDTTQGEQNSLVLIDSNHLILAYAGSSSDGFISTFSFDGSYDNITEIDSLEHDTAAGIYNSLIKIDATHYALAYAGTSGYDGYFKTFSIDGSYDTITEIASLEFDTDSGLFPSLVKLNQATYAVAHSGTGSDGFIRILTMDTDFGSLAEETSLEHDTVESTYNSLVLLDESHLALGYAGDGTDGYVKTILLYLSAESYEKSLVETNTHTDVFASTLTRVKALTDASTWTDVVDEAKAKIANLTDASTWTDVLDPLLGKGKILTEASTWTDAFTRYVAKAFAEVSTWTEGVSVIRSHVKDLEEESTWNAEVKNYPKNSTNRIGRRGSGVSNQAKRGS